jgi:hypothetical protein
MKHLQMWNYDITEGEIDVTNLDNTQPMSANI